MGSTAVRASAMISYGGAAGVLGDAQAVLWWREQGPTTAGSRGGTQGPCAVAHVWQVATTCVRPEAAALKRTPVAAAHCVGIQRRQRWVCAGEHEVSRVMPKPVDCHAKLGHGVVPLASGARAASVCTRMNPTKDGE